MAMRRPRTAMGVTNTRPDRDAAHSKSAQARQAKLLRRRAQRRKAMREAKRPTVDASSAGDGKLPAVSPVKNRRRRPGHSKLTKSKSAPEGLRRSDQQRIQDRKNELIGDMFKDRKKKRKDGWTRSAEELRDVGLKFYELGSQKFGKLSDLFRQFDDDCDGFISKKDFLRGCQKANMDKHPHFDVEQAFTAIDLDNNGQVDFQEFCNIFKQNPAVNLDGNSLQTENWKGGSTFKMHSGYLEKETRRACKEVGDKIKMIFVIDQLSYDGGSASKLASIFRHFDKGNSGNVSYDDFAKSIKKLDAGITEEDIKLACLGLDKEANGVISYTDWLAGMRSDVDKADWNPLEAGRNRRIALYKKTLHGATRRAVAVSNAVKKLKDFRSKRRAEMAAQLQKELGAYNDTQEDVVQRARQAADEMARQEAEAGRAPPMTPQLHQRSEQKRPRTALKVDTGFPPREGGPLPSPMKRMLTQRSLYTAETRRSPKNSNWKGSPQHFYANSPEGKKDSLFRQQLSRATEGSSDWQDILSSVKTQFKNSMAKPVHHFVDSNARLGFEQDRLKGMEHFDRFATTMDVMSEGNPLQITDKQRLFNRHKAQRAKRREHDKMHLQRVLLIEHKQKEKEERRIHARAKQNLRNLQFVESEEARMVRPVGKRTINEIVNQHNIKSGKDSIYGLEMRRRTNILPTEDSRPTTSMSLRRGRSTVLNKGDEINRNQPVAH